MRPACRTACLAGVLILLVSVLRVPNLWALETAVEDLLLAAKWDAVVQNLRKDERFLDDPVSRMVLAHAMLATNRNNGRNASNRAGGASQTSLTYLAPVTTHTRRWPKLLR